MRVQMFEFLQSLMGGQVVFHGLEARREVCLDGSRHNTKLHVRWASMWSA